MIPPCRSCGIPTKNGEHESLERCRDALIDHINAVEREVDRLRNVIKTGGAMYRAERAMLGIPGGDDPEGQPIRPTANAKLYDWEDIPERSVAELNVVVSDFIDHDDIHRAVAEAWDVGRRMADATVPKASAEMAVRLARYEAIEELRTAVRRYTSANEYVRPDGDEKARHEELRASYLDMKLLAQNDQCVQATPHVSPKDGGTDK